MSNDGKMKERFRDGCCGVPDGGVADGTSGVTDRD